jgi:hypothetical protein
MPDYAIRVNNGRVRLDCPACGASFKPEIGPWPFVPATWQPLCEDCANGVDRTTAADQAACAAFDEQISQASWYRHPAAPRPPEHG